MLGHPHSYSWRAETQLSFPVLADRKLKRSLCDVADTEDNGHLVPDNTKEES